MSKTIEKFHKLNPKILRLREFNRQFKIDPYSGLKEIINKKELCEINQAKIHPNLMSMLADKGDKK